MLSLLTKFNVLSVNASQCRTYVSARVLHPKKFTSILDNVPVRPRSAWQVYVRENLDQFRNREGKVVVTEATSALGKQWRALSEAEKKVYVDKYREEAAHHDASYKKALESATPQQFYDENVLRKKYKLPPLKDPQAPKRPRNAYLLYLEHLRQSDDRDFLNLNLKEQASEAAKRFHKLSESEKKKFNDMSKACMAEYHAEKEKYEAQIKTRPETKSSKAKSESKATENKK